MIFKTKMKAALVAGLFFISLGGLLLHYAIHPPASTPFGPIPFVAALAGVLIIPWLFCFRRTIHAAYLLNGFAVIIGTIGMAHYSLAKRPIWQDIAVLWPKFLIGYALFHLELFKPETGPALGWKTVRYPHLGYWMVHLFAVATVYALGKILIWS
jgi:hypothetical protein